MIGSHLRTERQCDTNWAYSFEVARVQVLLHAVHDNAVVLRRATSVVQVVDVRTALIVQVTQVHSNKMQNLP